MRADEARDRHFLNLDIGLPVEHFRPSMKFALTGDRGPEVALEAVNRRGKPIHCQVTCTPLFGPGKEVRGVILLMEELGVEKSP